MTLKDVLCRKGWEYKGVFDEPKLSELVEMYEEIGFDVRLEAFNPDEESGCTECMKTAADRFRMIFTKRQK